MSDPSFIYHWRRLDERVTTSGQPSEAELKAIAAIGVRCVINLALHSHEKALPDEAGCVAALGMTYVHIPVDFQHPRERDFTSFVTAMQAVRTVPVHVHCIANYRVSAFFYRYRRDVLEVDPATAQIDLDAIWTPDPVWSAFIARTG